MYRPFYGLRDIPFSLTPDPRYLYFTASHREVMANLHYGIQHGRGLIVATGEVGTGKTTTLRSMLARLDRSVLTSYIFNPGLTVAEFYHYLSTSFGITQYASKSDLLMKLGRLLTMRHSRGLRSVLIVDEAQGLAHELLEEIRLLLNFETYTEKQLQIILAGQPELRQVLNDPALRQLKQRISLRCEIKPLRAEEVSAYIRTRLKIAGATRLDIFMPEAMALIFRASEGVPRLINNICDNALLTGFAMSAPQITPQIVTEVIESLDLLQPMIEDDPEQAMQSGLPPMPILREEFTEKNDRFEAGHQPSRPQPSRRSYAERMEEVARHTTASASSFHQPAPPSASRQGEQPTLRAITQQESGSKAG